MEAGDRAFGGVKSAMVVGDAPNHSPNHRFSALFVHFKCRENSWLAIAILYKPGKEMLRIRRAHNLLKIGAGGLIIQLSELRSTKVSCLWHSSEKTTSLPRHGML